MARVSTPGAGGLTRAAPRPEPRRNPNVSTPKIPDAARRARHEQADHPAALLALARSVPGVVDSLDLHAAVCAQHAAHEPATWCCLCWHCAHESAAPGCRCASCWPQNEAEYAAAQRALPWEQRPPPAADCRACGWPDCGGCEPEPEPVTVVDLPLPEPQPPAGRPVIADDAASLAGCIAALGLQYRANERHGWRLELADAGADADDPATPWEQLTDRAEADLFARVERRWAFHSTRGLRPARYSIPRRRDCLLVLAGKRSADPVRVWLDWCARRHPNPPPQLGDLLALCFDVADGQDPDLLAWASAHVPLALVERTYRPGAEQHEHVVLVGPQGVGKTAFLRGLLPPQHRDAWFSNTLDLGDSPQRRIEATLGKAIVEGAELAAPRGAELAKVKNYLTTASDFMRLAYGRHPEDIPRRHVVAFTTNDERSLPNDLTGNRRFVPVTIASGDRQALDRYLDAERERLFAEAVHRWREGEQPRLPDTLKTTAATAAEAHRNRDDTAEDMLPQLCEQVGIDHDGALAVNTTRLAAAAKAEGLARSPRYWGQLLERDGWANIGEVRHPTEGKLRLWINPN